MLFVSTACLKAEKIVDVITEYAINGIRNIELSGGTKYYHNLENDLAMLKDKYDLNYACHAYFPPPPIDFVVNLASCNDTIYSKSLQHYIDCIGMLERLGINILSIHAGFFIEIVSEEVGRTLRNYSVYDRDLALRRFCAAFDIINSLCQNKKIEFYLENNVLSKANYDVFDKNNYFMMTDCEAIDDIRKQLDFNLLLDLAHLKVSSNTLGLNFANQCYALHNDVKWLHISDNDGVSDQHLPLIDGSDILDAYQRYFDKGINVTLETNGTMKEIKHSIELLVQIIK